MAIEFPKNTSTSGNYDTPHADNSKTPRSASIKSGENGGVQLDANSMMNPVFTRHTSRNRISAPNTQHSGLDIAKAVVKGIGKGFIVAGRGIGKGIGKVGHGFGKVFSNASAARNEVVDTPPPSTRKFADARSDLLNKHYGYTDASMAANRLRGIINNPDNPEARDQGENKISHNELLGGVKLHYTMENAEKIRELGGIDGLMGELKNLSKGENEAKYNEVEQLIQSRDQQYAALKQGDNLKESLPLTFSIMQSVHNAAGTLNDAGSKFEYSEETRNPKTKHEQIIKHSALQKQIFNPDLSEGFKNVLTGKEGAKVQAELEQLKEKDPGMHQLLAKRLGLE